MNESGVKCAAFCLLLWALLLFPAGAAAKGRALLISSYHPGFPSFSKQFQGLNDALGLAGVELDVEFMDSKRFTVSEATKLTHLILAEKLPHLPPYDIVITADDHALHFAKEHRGELFPGVPIIFFGVNDIELGARMGGDPLITGVLEAPSQAETFKLMGRLFPQAPVFHVIVDGTTSGQADLKDILRHSPGLDRAIEVVSLTEMNWDQLGAALGDLDAKTPILLLAAYVDANGHKKSFKEGVQWIMKHAHGPVFHLWEHGVGEGLLGGKIVSHYQQASIAGQIALEVLNGKSVREISIVDPNVANQYLFDHKVLMKHGLDESVLPSQSVVINKPSSLIEEYSLEIVTVGVSIIVLAVMGAVMTGYVQRVRASREAERDVRRLFQFIFDNVSTAVGLAETGGRALRVNKAFCDMLGYTEEEMLSLGRIGVTHPDDSETDFELLEKLASGESDQYEREKRVIHKNGSTLWVYVSSRLIRDENGEPEFVLAFVRDISDRKMTESVMRVRNEIVEMSNRLSLDQLLVKTLDRAEQLLDSQIGFFHFIAEDKGEVELQAWSTRTAREFCKVGDHGGTMYSVAQAGVWLDCLRRRTPVIHNDYASLPHKKGLPEGHAEVVRELSVPVLRNGKVVAVLGVGNKETEYNEVDQRGLSLLADVLWDTFQHKKAFDILKVSEEKFSKIFNASPVMITLTGLESGQYVDVNEHFVKVTGFSREEAIGTSSKDLKFLHPDERARVIAELEEKGTVRNMLVQAAKKGGEPLECISNGEVMEFGDQKYLLAFGLDISELKAAEKERERLARDYQRLFSRMLEGVSVHEVICDDNGVPVDYRFLAVNPAFEEMTGLKAHDLIGRTALELFPKFGAEWVDRFGKVALTGEPDICDRYFETIGKHFLMTTFQNAKNQFATIITDITRQKLAEAGLRKAMQEAEAANKVKSDFLASMSHEIRTPLNGIMGMLQLLEASSLDENQAAFVNSASVSSKRLTKLLCDILDHSRIEAGHFEMDNIPFSMGEIAQTLHDLFQVTAKNTELAYSIAVDPAIPATLKGDPERLVQVLSNLLGNAFKFTDSGGVHLEMHKMPSASNRCRVLCTVRDSGVGIPDDQLGVLFNPFTQVTGGYTRKYEGAGLGLSICKEFVLLMGGGICVDSTMGEGTTFYVNLEFDIEEERREEPEIVESREPACVGKRILIVEDDMVSSHALQRILNLVGVISHCVENGREAIAALAGESFDMILMDVQMPVMDGVEATKAIRAGEAGERNVSIPILALTAYAMPDDRQRFLDAGMDDYIPKPVDSEKLFNLMTSFFTKNA